MLPRWEPSPAANYSRVSIGPEERYGHWSDIQDDQLGKMRGILAKSSKQVVGEGRYRYVILGSVEGEIEGIQGRHGRCFSRRQIVVKVTKRIARRD